MVTFLRTLRDVLMRLDGNDEEGLEVAWQGLLEALVADTAADASALLVHQAGGLTPVAAIGLPDGIRGRTFILADHPRLAAIASTDGVCRFATDSPLPDPYDGLLDEALSPIHDCLGVALRDGQRLIGMVTLDALTPGCLADLDDQALIAAANLLATCLRLAERLQAARSQLAIRHQLPGERPLVTRWNSGSMRQLMSSVELVATTDMSVLVCGETGVGKEQVATALHRLSSRAEGPLVVVNCAALPASLIESALFGHRRGAFSGATRDHRGHFAMADGGTLVLDEIGELPLELQPKLLRSLQEGEIQALGSDEVRRVDVRVVAVTNRDLAAQVSAGRFREDLFHRLSAFPLRVPPLRERPEDLSLLIGHFLEQNRIRLGVGNLRVNAAAAKALSEWPWPGNVRELEHVLARASLMAVAAARDGADLSRRTLMLGREHLGLSTAAEYQTAAEPETAEEPRLSMTIPANLREATDSFQRQCIEAAFEAAGNWAGAARQLGMDAGNLHRLARRLGLKQ
ncbi:nitric oxide reductase transcriptional regulator NorR [Halomonas cupida]|uniref:nitric oxide reductase transcriptional regulator NorR n=1 Tax=Halomonas cupida TaxID=44933 RepID=UPI003A8C9CA1